MLTDKEVLDLSPFLKNLKRKGRLAPSRLNDLLSAAKGKLPPLAPNDCCGSSCKPCVNDLWKQECKGWDECHPGGIIDSTEEEEEGIESVILEKILIEERSSTPEVEITTSIISEESLQKTLQLSLLNQEVEEISSNLEVVQLKKLLVAT